MNKNKFFTIGLIAGSFFATSCDDKVDCGCDCNMPKFDKWEILKAGEEKNADGTIPSGTAIVVWGSNLTDITEISFNGMNAELQPAFMEDNKIIFQVPDGITDDCFAFVRTAGCDKGFEVPLLKVVLSAPCAAMCDNEMAVKTLKVRGNSFVAPLKAKFWDGEDYTLIASTEDETIEIEDQTSITIHIPEGVKDGGRILFENKAGERESEFIFRDTRNMLITHDDEEYLNLFNPEKPDVERLDEETGEMVGLPVPKDVLKSTVFASENTNGEFSIFHDIAGYTAWTYAPTGETNPTGVAPKYPTPFGCFSESIDKEETTFNDYVIKFEVFVPDDNPINGNGLAVGFYSTVWTEIRDYCAFWQPSKASFAKDPTNESIWLEKCTCENWTSGGDWMTVAIPFSEIRYNFTKKNYVCSAQNDRRIIDGSDDEYTAFGDTENGLAYLDLVGEDYVGNMMTKKVAGIDKIGLEFGNADQVNSGNEPLIAVDNLRIVPKDNNGGVWPLFKWGQSIHDFYINPITTCK